MSEIKTFIVRYLERKRGLPDDVDNYNFLENGHIDSIGLIRFVVSLEDKFNIEITSEEIASKDFCVVKQLVALIRKKIQSVS